LNSCDEKPTDSEQNKIKNTATETQVPNPAVDSIVQKKDSILPYTPTKRNEYLIVNKKQGIAYFNAPKGKLIGTLQLNTQIEVVEHTTIFDAQLNSKDSTKGEWLGINYNNDTVYVKNSNLGNDFTYSELKMYWASPFQIYGNQPLSGFINISEPYEYNYDSEEVQILDKNSIGNDGIQLNQKQKIKFLKSVQISPMDSIFIYNIALDTIYKFSVESMPMEARINIYAKGERGISHSDYEFGFNLGRKYMMGGDNFTCVSKTNPFQTGKISPIVWKKITDQYFPVRFDTLPFFNSTREENSRFKAEKSYHFTNEPYNYYLQNLTYDGRLSHRYLVITEQKTEQVVMEFSFRSGESSSLTHLTQANDREIYFVQYTGEFFKNKPAVIFGFLGHSFGCPTINFISKSEPPVKILCDNRH
jgi:hypothetical protein